jgi:multidrug efflux pump subunit AcrB
MNLSSAAIDKPRVVYVVAILVIIVSIFAAMSISVQRTPAIHKAIILVAVPHPGAQPTEVEEQITRKIEEKLQKLNNVDFVASSSMRGSSITQVLFLDGVDPDAARGEVKDLVDEVRRELPRARDVEPIVTDIDFENTPLMLVNLVAPDGFDPRSLKDLAEEVQEELESVAGIASTQLFGGREREIHVSVDLDLAAEHHVSLADCQLALSLFHAELPGGALETGDFDYQVRSDTKFRGLVDIREAVVRSEAGRVIRIKDVASVVDTYRRLKNVAHLDGHESATIVLYKESDINTLGTALAVKSRVEDLKTQYPFIEFSATRDTSEEISIMFRVLGSSFVFGAMLVLIILGWSMGLRISMLVLLAIPLSSGVGLICLYAFGVPISNMVIFSFILVLGMVVDGAIIVTENIHRHIELGKSPKEAAKTGIDEVAMPVLMADLTTVAAYLPMLMVPGIMGDFMGVMPVVVSVSLLGSVLVDHFLIPVLAAHWYTQRPQREGDCEAETAAEERRGLFTTMFVRVLNWSLEHRIAVVICTVLGIVWAGYMMKRIGFEFFPPSDRGQFEVKYELPLGHSIEQTIVAARVITEPLEEMKARDGIVVHFVSALGSSEGLASRLENDPAVGPEFGTVMVQLLSPLDRDIHEDAVINELRSAIDQRLDQVPGMKYSIVEVEEGPPGGSDVAIRFTGENHEMLGNVAEQVAARLESIQGVVDQRTDYRPENPEIVIDPNEDVLPFYDISNLAISQAIQTAVNGDNTIELSMNDEDVVLRLLAGEAYRNNLSSIRQMMITGPTGRKAPVGELARIRRTRGVHAVNRYERKRAVVAKCDVNKSTGLTSDKVFTELRDEILPTLGFRPVATSSTGVFAKMMDLAGMHPTKKNAITFLGRAGTPFEGVRATFTGENEERDKNFRYLLACMVIAVLLIFCILVIQFNSFRQTIVVLMTVPLSFVGVVGGMWLCQFPFSLATFIGLVSLAGVVVNDAIVVVDFVNQERRNLPLKAALLKAGANRLRPVLLTTVTTIGGLLPLFLNLSGGAEFWQPLTGAVVSGLAFATVLTLVVIPVLYSLVYNREFLASR